MNVPKGQLVLGKAKVIVQNSDEAVPRITECDVIASDALAAHATKRLMKKAIKRFGGIFGLLAITAMFSSQAPDFEAARHMPMVMGAITSAVATSFKAELGTATHNFTTGQHTVKFALYTSSSTLGASTAAYSSTNEISGTNYTA